MEKYIDSIIPVGMDATQAATFIDVDTNSTSTSTAYVDFSSCDFLSFYVEGKTGTHIAHIVCVECSPDGVFDAGLHDESTIKILGEGHEFIDASNIAFARMVVLTAEGVDSTCDFCLQGFRSK